MNQRIRVKILPFAIASLLAMGSAMAQNTSSSMTGRVVDNTGKPVVGATVQIVHVPSGTARIVTTDANGQFNAQGLRVGGPFDVIVSKAGLEKTEKDDVYLKLSETATVDLSMGVAAKQLAEVKVTGQPLNQYFQPDNKGLGTTITSRDLQDLPSTGRSLQDYVRLDPRIVITDPTRGEISALGQNSRYNNISIDAVPTNDPFGLESGGLPSLGQPISIDALEAIDVSTNNYDVTNARNVGAQINAVTKSGTNQYHGSLYYVYQPSKWVGDDQQGNGFTGYNKLTTAGGTFGGPVIKDKLFFFLSYEKSTTNTPTPDIGIIGSGKSSIVPITQAQLTQIQNIAQGYGFPTGSASASQPNTTEQRYLGKIDWNISDNHRVSFRYDRTKSNLAVVNNFYGGSTGSIGLASNQYAQERDFKNYVVNLYDDWSDTFSSETSISYGDYSRLPLLYGPLSPQVRVYAQQGPATNPSGPSVYMGTDYSYQANSLNTKTYTAFWAGTLFLNNHTVKFGLDFVRNKYNNLFLQYYAGAYVFNSIADFQNGNYASYQVRRPADGNLSTASAIWSYDNWGFFAQDDWQIGNLALQYGLRWDVPIVRQSPPFNAGFTQAFGLTNQSTINGHSVLEPRLSFNYSFDTDLRTQLRGGLGLFMGATPAVWQSNPFTNYGLNVATFQAFSPAQGGPVSANPANPVAGSLPSTQTIDLLAPNFQQPTVLKASLALDRELPWWGIIASAELSHLSSQDAIYYQNLNLGTPRAFGPDGRPLFWKVNSNGTLCTTSSCAAAYRNPNFGSVIELGNTNLGEANYITLQLQKPYGNDWSWSLAYTHGNSTEVNPGTSSVAYSNWRYSQGLNPNAAVASPSNYSIPNRITASLTWSHRFFGDYATRVGTFLDAHTGRPYSWTFGNDANGDQVYGNDSIYIPKGPGDVLFTSTTTAQMQQQFFQYIQADSYLRSHEGQVAGRNAVRSPWVHELDLRIAQEIPGLFKGNKGVIQLDIYNLLNLVNKNWGQFDQIGFPYGRSLADFAGIDPATGKYIYNLSSSAYKDANGNYAPSSFQTADTSSRPLSRWSVQLTLNYKF